MTEQLHAGAFLAYQQQDYRMVGAAPEGIRFVRHGDKLYAVEFLPRSTVTHIHVWHGDDWADLWNQDLPMNQEAMRVWYFVETTLETAP